MASEARTLSTANVDELAEWCGGKTVVEYDALDSAQSFPGINVPVGKGLGVKRASLGDTIIQNNDGTFQVFKS